MRGPEPNRGPDARLDRVRARSLSKARGRRAPAHRACDRCGVPLEAGDRCPDCLGAIASSSRHVLEAFDEIDELELVLEARR